MTITEGILAEWSKADGDLVAREEPLLVLETDKITMNVNAQQAGKLTILVDKAGNQWFRSHTGFQDDKQPNAGFTELFDGDPEFMNEICTTSPSWPPAPYLTAASV